MLTLIHRGTTAYIRATDSTPQINLTGVRTFVAFNFIGGIGLLIVVLTALLNPNVKRLPTWYSFCASWVLSCIAYTLLTFGGQQTTPQPSYRLCFAQAALVYATPTLTSCTTLALLIQILYILQDAIASTPNTLTSVHSPPSLLIGPYFVFLVVLIGVLLDHRDLQRLQRQQEERIATPKIQRATRQRVSFAFVGAISLLILVVQIHVALRIYRSPHIMRRNSPTLATALRGMLFSVIGVLTVLLSTIFAITEAQSLVLDIILATLPILALIVFGSQQDLIHSWLYWKSE